MKIIAEIGINHDGNIKKAEKLIRQSFESGVWAVKFQYRNLDNAYTNTSKEIGDEILIKEITKNYLSPSSIVKLSQYSKTIGLKVGISFFDENDITDFSEFIHIFDLFKIPSVELTNYSLIDHLLSYKKHLYLSLGAHDENEVVTSLSRLPKKGWTPMHCISNYPVTLQNARLGYISYLQKYWNRSIGYSSHDDNWEVCLLAMQFGISVLERHITLDRSGKGLDHSTSSTQDHFKKIHEFSLSMSTLAAGNTPRIPNQGELLNRQNLGRSYYARKNINIGEY